jgi:hypothetical protein
VVFFHFESSQPSPFFSPTELDNQPLIIELVEQLHARILKKETKHGAEKQRMTLLKLKQLTGRDNSLLSIQEFINPETPQEARLVSECSKKKKKVCVCG